MVDLCSVIMHCRRLPECNCIKHDHVPWQTVNVFVWHNFRSPKHAVWSNCAEAFSTFFLFRVDWNIHRNTNKIRILMSSEMGEVPKKIGYPKSKTSNYASGHISNIFQLVTEMRLFRDTSPHHSSNDFSVSLLDRVSKMPMVMFSTKPLSHCQNWLKPPRGPAEICITSWLYDKRINWILEFPTSFSHREKF